MKKWAVLFIFVVLTCVGFNLYRSKSIQMSGLDPELGDILQACREVSEEFISNRKATYNLKELAYGNIKKSYKRDAICAPTYVAMVLYKSKILTENQINSFNYNWCGEGGLPDLLQAAGWKQIAPEEIRPGDIVVKYSEYCCIYEGPNLYWDYTDCIREEKSAVSPHPTCIRLDECLIFRAPKKPLKVNIHHSVYLNGVYFFYIIFTINNT